MLSGNIDMLMQSVSLFCGFTLLILCVHFLTAPIDNVFAQP